ncbi:MAG: ROK family protein [Actinobacteria bacterium]|nr:ROK family protein [Actinomycetota bacterium]
MSDQRVIGVDLGGTKILAGVVDRAGNVYETLERPTVTTSQGALLDELASLVQELPQQGIGAVGFGVPARVDQKTGIALGAVNIPIRDIEFRGEMAKRLSLPVGIENDGNAAANAEFTLGAGRDVQGLVMLTLGTGVGGGVVIDGRLFRGWAELGHIVIVEDGEPCQGACSGRGHVEAYCSGRAADKVARRELGPNATAHDLVDARHPAVEAIGHHLGVAIGSLVNVFNPELVVIGGGFGVAAFDLLMPAARLAVLTEALAPGGQELAIEAASLGARAGLIGAALAAFEALG